MFIQYCYHATSLEITGDDRDTIFLTPAMLVFNGPLDTIVSCANFENYLLGDGNYTHSGGMWK